MREPAMLFPHLVGATIKLLGSDGARTLIAACTQIADHCTPIRRASFRISFVVID